MSDKKPFEPEKLSITEFRLITGQINAPEDFEIESIKSFMTENAFELGFNIEKKLIRSDFKIEISTITSIESPIVAEGKYHLMFIFNYQEFDNVINTFGENQLMIDDSLASAIAAVTYSTSRGILITRLQGTPLQNFILPIINANNLLQHPEQPN